MVFPAELAGGQPAVGCSSSGGRKEERRLLVAASAADDGEVRDGDGEEPGGFFPEAAAGDAGSGCDTGLLPSPGQGGSIHRLCEQLESMYIQN